MRKQILSKTTFFAGIMLILLFFISCYHFDFVYQPYSADVDESFEVAISATVNNGIGTGYTIPYFGIHLPVGWTVNDSILFTYNNSIGRLIHSDSLSHEMSQITPAVTGYYWWVATTEVPVYYAVQLTYSLKPVINTDSQSGMFFLDYMLGNESEGLNHDRSDNHLITVSLPSTVMVTNSNNDGPGSLRAAIDDVDFYGSIEFDLNPGDTIFLQKELKVYKDISITGSENIPIVISGNHMNRVINIEADRNVHLSNLHLVNGKADFGGGILCEHNSNTQLENITISYNSSELGGGIYCANANLIFDSTSRCNIYLNNAGWQGNDIYSIKPQNVYLDTFTVMLPTDFYINPIDRFSVDILNAKIDQVDADLHVSPLGDNNNSGLTADDPLKTIRKAFSLLIGDSLHQNTIQLQTGIYSPSSNGELFPIQLQDYISLSGVSKDSVVLDAEGSSSVIETTNTMGSNVYGLCICGGAENYGHAVQIESSQIEIQDVLITNNLDGGLHNSGSGLILTDVDIVGNSINGNGGGMFLNDANPILKNVIISNNIASEDGGGIVCSDSEPYLENVRISHNIAGEWGGGIHGHGNNIIFDSTHRCNIYLNEANYGSDIHFHYSDSHLNVILDTFTVMHPTAFHINPPEYCNVDILNSKLQQVDADLFVSTEGNDGNSGLSQNEPLKTIQNGMMKIWADSLHRNKLILMEGIYGPSSSGDILPLVIPDYFSICGTTASEVILDAENQSSVVIIDSDRDIHISGLSLTGGYEDGCIQCRGNPTFQNLIISNNNGPGVRHLKITGNANIKMINVLIADNLSTGLICSRSEMHLTNVTIADNGGHGIFCLNGSDVLLENSIVSNNALNAIEFLNFNPENYVYSYFSNIHGNILTNWNGSVYQSTGAIMMDPHLNGYGEYPFALSQASPCIDAGKPDTAGMNLPQWDIVGNQRIWDGNGNDTAIIDMGAYEFGSMPVGYPESSIQHQGSGIYCFPNPSCTISDIRYSISDIRYVTLSAYDLSGKQIIVLVNEVQTSGEYNVNFDVSDLPDGMYLIRLKAGNESVVSKLLVVH